MGLLQQLCRSLSPGSGEKQAGVGVFPPSPDPCVSVTRLPTSSKAKSEAPGPNVVWLCPREADSERTWGCPPRCSERWVLQPLPRRRMGEFGDCNRVRKSCCRRKAKLSDSPGRLCLCMPATSSLMGHSMGRVLWCWAVTNAGWFLGLSGLQRVRSEDGFEPLGLSQCC